MSVTSKEPTENTLLIYQAMSIVLDNQGIVSTDARQLTLEHTTATPTTAMPQTSVMFGVEPIDWDVILKIRETSKNLHNMADDTLKRLHRVLPSDALIALDHSVVKVNNVFNFDNQIRDRFGDDIFNRFLQYAQAQSRWLSPEAIDHIIQSQDQQLIVCLLKNHNIPEQKRQALGTLVLNQLDVETKITFANDTNTPQDWLDLLAKDTCSLVRQAVAKNSHTRSSTLLGLAKTRDVEVQCCVAKNPNTCPLALHHLAQQLSDEIRTYVASHLNISEKTMQLLSLDQSIDVREALASNTAVNPDILRALYQQGCTKIKRALAANPSTPAQLLIELAQDGDWDTRYAITTNPAATEPAFRHIIHAYTALTRQDPQDLNPTIAYQAIRTVLLIASIETISSDILRDLYQLPAPVWDFSDEWDDLKTVLAENPKTPVSILRELLRLGTEEILEALAHNQALPAELKAQLPNIYHVLSQIVNSGDDEQISWILFDFELPDDVHEQIPNLFEAILRTNAWESLIRLASDTTTPKAILQALAQKQDWHIWAALAANSSFPQESIGPLIDAVNASPLELMHEIELATELVLHRQVPVTDMARWSFKSENLDEAITADPRWQKVAARILDLSSVNQEWADSGRARKRLRFV